jgi:ABC-type dipeptide/oligopeptide/nickel transport system permease component
MLLASLLAFLILEVSPGNIVHTLLGDEASLEQEMALQVELGLDEPLLIRYLGYILNLVQGDMGVSMVSGRPVAQLIGQRFVNTLFLASLSILLAVGIGFTLGIWASLHHQQIADLAVIVLTSVALSFPSFGLAILLTQFFSLQLGWLPAFGGGSVRHLVLPCIALTVPTAAVIARVVRSKMHEELNKTYVLTALSKGLALSQVWWKHVIRNAVIPALTVIGVQFGHLLGGAFIVETIFAWPGLGRLTVQAIFDRDFPVVLGAVVLSAILFQLCNAIVDIAHMHLDPRIRQGIK